jgi:hypothetical protein
VAWRFMNEALRSTPGWVLAPRTDQALRRRSLPRRPSPSNMTRTRETGGFTMLRLHDHHAAAQDTFVCPTHQIMQTVQRAST